MSILIKGMAMPKNCGDCPFYYENKHDRGDDSLCLASGKEAKCGCPLVPIPPHGDLIDRDALTTVTEMVNGEFKTYIEVFEVEDAPTIIEAEGEND